MLIDRKVYFDNVRKKPFGGHMTLGAVQGQQFTLDIWERLYQKRTPVTQFAYCLGTTYHESGHTMQPIHEYGNRAYFMRMYDKTGARPKVAASLGNTQVGDGAKYPGMGLIQATGRGNAKKITQKLRKIGIIDNTIDFEATPELLMRPDIANHVMFLGMEEGWFTGRTLDTNIDVMIDGDEHSDFLKARAIINGKDRAEMIAGYADQFLKALRAAQLGGTPPPLPPVPLPISRSEVVAQAPVWKRWFG